MKRYEFLKYYAGTITVILTFILYAVLMFRYTDKDMIEILVTYGLFIMFPAFLFPFIITEEKDNDTE